MRSPAEWYAVSSLGAVTAHGLRLGAENLDGRLIEVLEVSVCRWLTLADDVHSGVGACDVWRV